MQQDKNKEVVVDTTPAAGPSNVTKDGKKKRNRKGGPPQTWVQKATSVNPHINNTNQFSALAELQEDEDGNKDGEQNAVIVVVDEHITTPQEVQLAPEGDEEINLEAVVIADSDDQNKRGNTEGQLSDSIDSTDTEEDYSGAEFEEEFSDALNVQPELNTVENMERQANSESPKQRDDAPQTPASCASSASVVRCTPSRLQQLINEATEVIQAIDHPAQVDQTPPRPPDKAKERWADIQEDNTETSHAGKFALLTELCPVQNITSSKTAMSKKKRSKRLSKLIKEWDPDLLGIAEPKIDSNAISKSYIQSLGLCVTFFCNSNNQQLPNIWLLWKEGFSAPNLIHRSNQQLTIECNGSIVTMVHASTLYVQRRSLWQELAHLNPLNTPWSIMGDFNAYLSPSEKKGGLRPTSPHLWRTSETTLNMNQLLKLQASVICSLGLIIGKVHVRVGGKIDRVFSTLTGVIGIPDGTTKYSKRLCFRITLLR
ncbi:hypothetical protein IFM89_027361 [Coptis chinensis]|uniref:Endonuclease/exonuclease/phosphatase domain-containing protein n=1 Tax=Coptis chinensis TaxID=261450 RepID=A0A835LNU1_9MAGN|nr:hypothetical protein IFM89_027361 [Coptis chinensis]